MKEQNITDFNFLEGKQISDDSYESNVFLYKGDIYKIFKEKKIDDMNNKEQKIRLLSTLKSDFLVLPKELLYNNGKFIGYTMDYVHGVTLNEYLFSKTNQKIELLKKVKEAIEEAHYLGIILGDISIYNILVDGNQNIHICDIDNCCIDKFFHDNLKIFQQSYLLHHNYDKSFDYFVFNIETMNLLTKHISPYVLTLMQNGLYEDMIDEKAFYEFTHHQQISGSPYIIDHLQKKNIKKKLLSIFK